MVSLQTSQQRLVCFMEYIGGSNINNNKGNDVEKRDQCRSNLALMLEVPYIYDFLVMFNTRGLAAIYAQTLLPSKI